MIAYIGCTRRRRGTGVNLLPLVRYCFIPGCLLLGSDEFLVGGIGHKQIVLLLAKLVFPLPVLVDEVGSARRGRAVPVGEPLPPRQGSMSSTAITSNGLRGEL
jgi:hypothetical protein